jgi:hypothetical protein
MTIRTTSITRILRLALAILLAFVLTDVTALAQRNRGNVRSTSRSSVNNNRNVNRNTNVNQNRNVNRNIDIDRDIDVDVDVDRRYGYGGGCCYHSGWGTAAAVAATAVVTAAVVGSMVHTLPPSCSTVIVNGFAYQQCGSTWYQPQLGASSTTYIVVNPPR